MPDFDPRTTALVLIDLQKGIVGMPLVPHSGDAVLAKSRELAERFRAAGAPVVLVHVGFSEDFADAPSQNVDQPTQRRQAMPADWTEFAEGLAKPKDILILKRQWGAFYGTDLDLQLRRRGVTTVVIGGIATNMGVESTARTAHEHGYAVVLAEDAATTFSAEMHAFAFEHIFPHLGRVAKADEIEL